MFAEFIGEILAIAVALGAAGGFVYFKGRSAVKNKVALKDAKQSAKQAQQREAEVRRVADTVANVRNDVSATPGASEAGVAASVREALAKEPKSTQGRLGGMARDK